MTKLYFSPGACSLSPHIVLREAGLPFDLVRVDLRRRQLADGSDYLAVNPKGYVPVLELDDGERLTEGPAIVQYLADQVPDSGLAPAAGTMARYRLIEWLNFITSELHKGYSPLFKPDTPDAYKTIARDRLLERYTWVDAQLAGNDHLMGETFTVADAYLYTVTSWARHAGVDLEKLAALVAYQTRVAARPAVQAAMAAEGLKR